jgi:hypothetical protein
MFSVALDAPGASARITAVGGRPKPVIGNRGLIRATLGTDRQCESCGRHRSGLMPHAAVYRPASMMACTHGGLRRRRFHSVPLHQRWPKSQAKIATTSAVTNTVASTVHGLRDARPVSRSVAASNGQTDTARGRTVLQIGKTLFDPAQVVRVNDHHQSLARARRSAGVHVSVITVRTMSRRYTASGLSLVSSAVETGILSTAWTSDPIIGLRFKRGIENWRTAAGDAVHGAVSADRPNVFR